MGLPSTILPRLERILYKMTYDYILSYDESTLFLIIDVIFLKNATVPEPVTPIISVTGSGNQKSLILKPEHRRITAQSTNICFRNCMTSYLVTDICISRCKLV